MASTALLFAALAVVIFGTLGAPYPKDYHIVSTHVVPHTTRFKRSLSSPSHETRQNQDEDCHYLSLTHVDPDLDFCFKIHVEEGLRLVLMDKEGEEEFKLPNTPEGALVKGYATAGVRNSSALGYLHEGQFFGRLAVHGKDFVVDHIHTHDAEGAPFPARRDHKAIVYRHVEPSNQEETADDDGKELRRSKRAAPEKFGAFGRQAKEKVPFHEYNPVRTFHPERTYPVVCRLVFMADHVYYKLVASGSEGSLLAFLKVVTYAVNIRYIFSHVNYEPGKPNPGTRSDNIRFRINDIVLFKDTDQEGYPITSSFEVTNAQSFLGDMSMGLNLQEFCLGIVVSGQLFKEGPPGAAFVPTPKKMTGGICEETLWVGGRMMSRNLVVVSAAASETTLNPMTKTSTTIAHYMAIAMGAKDEKSKKECHPKDPEKNGYYLMYSDDQSGNLPNHWLLSNCSKMDIKSTLKEKINCFTVGDTSYCGNGIIERGEECDCGTEHVRFECGGHNDCCQLALHPEECKIIIPKPCADGKKKCAMCGEGKKDKCEAGETPCAQGEVPCIHWAKMCDEDEKPCVACNKPDSVSKFFPRVCTEAEINDNATRVCDEEEPPCIHFRMCEEEEIPCFPCLDMTTTDCDKEMELEGKKSGLAREKCENNQNPCRPLEECGTGKKSCKFCPKSGDCREKDGSFKEGYCDTDRLEPELPCAVDKLCEPGASPCVLREVAAMTRDCPDFHRDEPPNYVLCQNYTFPCKLMPACTDNSKACDPPDEGKYCQDGVPCAPKTEACRLYSIPCLVECPEGKTCTDNELCGPTKKPCVSPKLCSFGEKPCTMCGQPGYPECSTCDIIKACGSDMVPCVVKKACEDTETPCRCGNGDETCDQIYGLEDVERVCFPNEVSCLPRKVCTGSEGPCKSDRVDPDCPPAADAYDCSHDEMPCQCKKACDKGEKPCLMKADWDKCQISNTSLTVDERNCSDADIRECYANTYPCIEAKQCKDDEWPCTRCGKPGEPSCTDGACVAECSRRACTTSCARPFCNQSCEFRYFDTSLNIPKGCWRGNCLKACSEESRPCYDECWECDAACSTEACLGTCADIRKMCDVECLGVVPEGVCGNKCDLNHKRCDKDCESQKKSCLWACKLCVKGCEKCTTCSMEEMPCEHKPVCGSEKTPEKDNCFRMPVACVVCNNSCTELEVTEGGNETRCDPGVRSCEVNKDTHCQMLKTCAEDETPCVQCGAAGQEPCSGCVDKCKPGELPCLRPVMCDKSVGPCYVAGSRDEDKPSKCFQPDVKVDRECLTNEISCVCPTKCAEDEEPCNLCEGYECSYVENPCAPGQFRCARARDCGETEVPCCQKVSNSCSEVNCGAAELPCLEEMLCEEGVLPCVPCGKADQPRCGDCNITCKPSKRPCRIRPMCSLEEAPCCPIDNTTCGTSKLCNKDEVPCKRMPMECKLGQAPCKEDCMVDGKRDPSCLQCDLLPWSETEREKPCVMPRQCDQYEVPCILCGREGQDPCTNCSKPCDYGEFPCRRVEPCKAEDPCGATSKSGECRPSELPCQAYRDCQPLEVPCVRCGGSRDEPKCEDVKLPKMACGFADLPCVSVVQCEDEYPCCSNESLCKRQCDIGEVACRKAEACEERLPCAECDEPQECSEVLPPEWACDYDKIPCLQVMPCNENEQPCFPCRTDVECYAVLAPLVPCRANQIPCKKPEMCGKDRPCVYCNAPRQPMCGKGQVPCAGNQVPCQRAIPCDKLGKGKAHCTKPKECELDERPCLPCGNIGEPECDAKNDDYRVCDPNEVPCTPQELPCQPSPMGKEKPLSPFYALTKDTIRQRPYGDQKEGSASAALGKASALFWSCVVAMVLTGGNAIALVLLR